MNVERPECRDSRDTEVPPTLLTRVVAVIAGDGPARVSRNRRRNRSKDGELGAVRT